MNRQLSRGEILAGAIWLAVYAVVLDPLLAVLLAPYPLALRSGAVFLLRFLITVAVFWRFLRDSLEGIRFGKLFRGVLMGFCACEFLQVGLGILYDALLPELSVPNDDSLRELFQESPWVLAAGAVLLSPITEETLFRGLVFGGKEKAGPWAWVVSCLSFGLVHVIGFGLSPLEMLKILPLYALPGAALCLCYVYSGTIWGPILLHAVINGIGVLGMK